MSQTIHHDLEFVVGEFRRLLNRVASDHEITMTASRTPHGFCLRWGPEQATETTDMFPWHDLDTLRFEVNYGAHRKTVDVVWLMDEAGNIRSGRPIKRGAMIHLIGADDFVPAYWQPYVIPAVPLSIAKGGQ